MRDQSKGILKGTFVNPHQDILERLKNRPFYKSKLTTSKSAKNFLQQVQSQGLPTNLVIFENNFVKNFSQFSQHYLDLHVLYNTQEDNNQFLNEYTRVVQPRRWERIYKSIAPKYSKNTEDQIFSNKINQNNLFSRKDEMHKPMEVLACTDKKKLAQEKVMKEIKEKLGQIFVQKSEGYNRKILQQHQNRKQLRQQRELSLPKLTIDEKKEKIIEIAKQARMSKRIIPQDLIKELTKDITKQSISNLNINESTQLTRRQNQSSQQSLLIRNLNNHSAMARPSRILNDTTSKSASTTDFPMHTSPSVRVSIQRMGTFEDEQEEDDSPKRKSNHQQIASAIFSLRRLTNRFIQEKQKKFQNEKVIDECLDLCGVFIRQLKANRQTQNEFLNKQVLQTLGNIESAFQTFKVNKQEVKQNLQQTRVLKASFLQKLQLINIQKNQLKNTSLKYNKYYMLPKVQQELLNVNYMKKPQELKTNLSAIHQEEEDVEATQELDCFEVSVINQQKQSAREQYQNTKTEESPSQTLPSLDNKELIRRSSIKKADNKRSVKKPRQEQRIQNILDKKQTKNKFDNLVAQKDMKKLVEDADIQKVVQTVIEEMEPYVYYDEVINQYFGGHIDLAKSIDEKKKKKNREMIVDSTIRDLIILSKEDAMTSSKALQSIENHVKNEKLLNFQEKQRRLV